MGQRGVAAAAETPVGAVRPIDQTNGRDAAVASRVSQDEGRRFRIFRGADDDQVQSTSVQKTGDIGSSTEVMDGFSAVLEIAQSRACGVEGQFGAFGS